FAKKDPREIVAIIDKRITATLKRVHAIADQKSRLDDLEWDNLDKFNQLVDLVDRLNWIDIHSEEAGTWLKANLNSTSWGLFAIGKISFVELRSNFPKILDQLLQVYQGHYFDWIQL
ncbi:hypothetical protein OE88DRAFT_1620667, partial [Heliocybe sulcata]